MDSEDLLDLIEENDESEDGQQAIDATRSEFISRLSEWNIAYNAVIQPILDTVACQIRDESGQATPLPATFPLRNDQDLEPTVKNKDERAKRGLPPLRARTSKAAKSALWKEIDRLAVPLPSSFDPRVLAKPACKPLVDWEIKVREAQANDALNDLRTAIIATQALKLAKLDTNQKVLR